MTSTILFISPVSAEEPLSLNYCTSYITISEDVAYEKIVLEYTVKYLPGATLVDSIYVFGKLSKVKVYDRGGILVHSTIPKGNLTEIRYYLRRTLRSGERSRVTVEFEKGIEFSAGAFSYELAYIWDTPPGGYEVMLRLPEEYTLLSGSENASIYTRENYIFRNWSPFRHGHIAPRL